MRTNLTAAALAALAASPAAAQDWTFDATLYGWLPAISTSFDTARGTVESDVSASDAVDNLDFAFMGALEARRGKWGFIGDLVYSDISADKPTERGVLFRKGVVETRLTLLSGYAAYRLQETDKVALDVAAGFRAFWTDLEVTLEGARARTRRWSDDQNWAVPLVAARLTFPISERWKATLFGDFGGISSDETTWQALATLHYDINRSWSAVVAYRYMDVSYQIDGRDAEIELYGPALGVTFRF